MDKLHSNISLRKIPKPSKPQLKNIQSSKFSTRTRHFFAVKKGGGCLDQWAHSLTFQHGMCHAGNRVSTNSHEPWVPSGKEVTSMLHPGKIASVVGLVWLVCGGGGGHAKGEAIQMDPVPTLAWDHCFHRPQYKRLSSWYSKEQYLHMETNPWGMDLM